MQKRFKWITSFGEEKMYLSTIKKMLLPLILTIGLLIQPSPSGLASPKPAAPPATGSEIWLAAYDSPDKQADTGNSVSIDNAGNTYVAGTSDSYSSGKNIVLIKYSPTGAALWTKMYNGPGSSGGGKDDQAVAIAVDDQGFVYLVGNSDSETNKDIIVLRYRPDGTLDWEKRYNGPASSPANQMEYADTMILTMDAVYVAGKTYDDNGEIVILLKYGMDGEFQWERHYAAGGPSHLAIAQDGSIYQLGGVYSQLLGVYHFALVKYQPDGTRSWDKLYHQDDPYTNGAAGVQVDSQGNIIVGGVFERQANFGTAFDAGLIKFDPSGNILWDRRIVDPNQQNYLDVFGFAIDSSGSSYLFTTGMYIIKYDSSGNQAWRIHSDELSVPVVNKAVLKLGSDQSLYITSTYGVMKFGPAGNVLLSYQHGTDPFEGLLPTDFALGPDGNIAITGMYHDPDTYSQDMLTIKYPGNPGVFLTVEDVFISEGSRSSDNRTANFVVRLSKSLTYFIDFKYQTVDLSAQAGSDYQKTEGASWISPGPPQTVISVPILPDTTPEADKQFQLKILTANGAVIVRDRATATILDDDFDLVAWAKSIPTPGSEEVDTFDLKTDSQGNGYIKFGVGISSFNPAGNLRWTKTFPGMTISMQLDAQDNLFQTGEDSSKRLVIRKLDNAGNIIWERFYSDSMKGEHSGSTIAVDAQGNVFVAGIVPSQTGSNPVYDTILLKYSQAGDMLWERRLHSPGVEFTYPNSIFTDSAGNVTLAGNAYNPGSYGIINKYAPNGDLLWDDTYTNSGYSWNFIYQTQSDASGNLYLAVNNSSGSGNYVTIVKINAIGQKLWEEPCGFVSCGSGEDLQSLKLDSLGNLIVTFFDTSGGWAVKSRGKTILWRWQFPMYSVLGEAASDAEGFTYVTGGQQTSGSGYAFIYMVFSPSGVPLYERTESGQGSLILGMAPFMVVNKDHSAYAMAGSIDSAIVAKYAPIPLPAEIRVTDTSTKEPENAQRTMTFSVQLSKALDHDISLDYHTVDGIALASQDYLPVQGKLTIPAHSRSASIQVPILSDSLLEPGEFFYLTLSEPPDGTIYARSIATGKIVDSSAIQLSLPLILQN
jgi:Calx-beta domain